MSSITNTGPGTQVSSYSNLIRLWSELDGVPVPVVPAASTNGASGSGTPGADDGKVVFCNREFTRTTMFGPGESIHDVESTEQSNAFNWVAMNVGNGIHSIVVKADFVDSSSDATSHGVI